MSKTYLGIIRTSLILAVSPIVIITGCNNAAPPVSVSNQPVSINGVTQPGVPPKPVAMMSWTGTDGKEQRMQDLEGKVIVLDFWATYCEPCRREIPHLNQLQAKYGSDKLQVIGMNVGGDEDEPKIPKFVQELKVSYPVAFPEDSLVEYIFQGSDAIPQTAVFDRKGQFVTKIVGFDDSVRADLENAIDKAIRQ